MNNNKMWFVTGASKGLGLSLVKKLLEHGFRVAATSRNSAALIEGVGKRSEQFLPLEMDLLNERSVQAAIQKTRETFGKIDVVVNNAGYGQMGTLEELTDEEARGNFDVNVFGALNVIRAAMLVLREQRAGHIFNISSIAGYTANFAGWGIYCATKFALTGLSEGLAAEAKAFGVKVTIAYPGYFRTEFLSPDSVAKPQNPIAEYQEARQSQALHENEINGNQTGDPIKAAEVLIQIAAQNNPPLHLFLGSDAYQKANEKIAEVQTDLKHWKEYSISTDFGAQNNAREQARSV